MSHLNIEIKARCTNTGPIRKLLKLKNAEFKGEDHQVDTYFCVDKGRLKLREGSIEHHLIHYERESGQGPKASRVSLYSPNPASPLKEVLSCALGVLAVVDKRREIYFIENVKFHIDQVEGLGSFVEIEAIDKDGTIGETRLRRQCENYIKGFSIRDSDLLSDSYSDMLLNSALQA